MPNQNFGPWTTSLTAGSQLELSAFWKRRLGALASIASLDLGVGRRARLLLAATVIAILLVPLLYVQQYFAATTKAQEAYNIPEASAPSSPVGTADADRVRMKLEMPTEIGCVHQPLTEAVRYLSEYHGVPIWWDNAALDAEDISLNQRAVEELHLSGVRLSTVLKFVLEPEGLGYFIDRDNLIVTTHRKAAALDTHCRYDVADIVRGGVPPGDLADAIARSVSPATWRLAKGSGYIQVSDTSLVVSQRADVQSLIQSLLSQLRRAQQDAGAAGFDEDRIGNWTYDIGELRRRGISEQTLVSLLRSSFFDNTSREDGTSRVAIEGDELVLRDQTWRVSAAVAWYLKAARDFPEMHADRANARLAAAIGAPKIASAAAPQLIRRQLGRLVTIKLTNLPLEEAIRDLRDAGGCQIVVNAAELKRLGVSLKAPVTWHGTKRPLADALDEVLEPLELGWYVEEPGLIVVTGSAAAASQLEPRVYRIGRLLAAGQTAPMLVERVTSTVAPETWTKAGGSGATAVLPGLLVVVNNQRVHSKIEQLLETLATEAKSTP